MPSRRRRREREARWTRRAAGPVSNSQESQATGRGRLWLALGVVVLVPLVAAGVATFVLFAGGSDDPSLGPRAAIVDQLSLTHPNPAFIEQATGLLEGAGYTVDYFPGEQVTIELYRGLPEGDYDYLLMRVHTAQFIGEWRGEEHDEPVLFTSESYSEELHIDEQWELQLNPVFAFEGAPRFFGIAPNFVESAMSGDLDGAVVVLMGCGGLQTGRLAEAFMSRGADEVVGWTDLVSAPHTDEATKTLLTHLLQDRLPLDKAVAQTMTEVGRDPAYESILIRYDGEG